MNWILDHLYEWNTFKTSSYGVSVTLREMVMQSNHGTFMTHESEKNHEWFCWFKLNIASTMKIDFMDGPICAAD